MNEKVTAYIEKKTDWSKELITLRNIMHQLPVEETVKWGSPFYTNGGKNIVGMSAFKNYFGLWFIQGATLKDEKKVLINAQEGKTSAMRQWRFNSIDEIDEKLIKEYVLEAIENKDQGKVIKPKKKPLIIPELLQKALDNDSQLKENFEAFTLSKKREYADHISEAKREATKQSRLEKIIPMILNNVGLYDKYKNC
ncbi:YdeI/OmpD-associated family protein [Pseudotenacibaculum haliotis]|uniref:YdeI family protein n=1 Tax=Pseudotenacibaculum haliotis TaxID=1862138 RepID=A0ABW5LSG5_9FLAO